MNLLNVNLYTHNACHIIKLEIILNKKINFKFFSSLFLFFNLLLLYLLRLSYFYIISTFSVHLLIKINFPLYKQSIFNLLGKLSPKELYIFEINSRNFTFICRRKSLLLKKKSLWSNNNNI